MEDNTKQTEGTTNLPAVRDKWVGDTFSLAPKTIEEALKFADIIAKSSMVPPQFKDKPADVLVAVQMGMEVGLKPLQALQNIAVINGRPCLWGDAVLAVIQASGLLEYIEENDNGTEATCTMKRRGYPNATTRTFSVEDAKKANLATKQGPWTQYPSRMRQLRARAFCARDLFADVLKGISVAEEVQDYQPIKNVTPTNGNSKKHDTNGTGNRPEVESPAKEVTATVEPPRNGTTFVESVKKNNKTGMFHIVIGEADYYTTDEAVARFASKCSTDKTAVVPAYEENDGKRTLTELQTAQVAA